MRDNTLRKVVPGGWVPLRDGAPTGQGRWTGWKCGPEGAPLLVFLHGFLGTGADWRDVVGLGESLSSRWQCLAVDLPGSGLDGATPPCEPGSVLRVARATVAQVRAVGKGQPAVWVGYSMGGRVALTAALQSPSLVRALVLESANPGLSHAEERLRRAELDTRRAEEIRRGGIEAFVDRWYRKVSVFASLQRRPALLESCVHRRQISNSAMRAAHMIETMSPGRCPDAWPLLPELVAPTLLLAGQEDPSYVERLSRAAARMPAARFETVAGAGHNIHRERPEVFVRLLRHWLEGLGGEGEKR